MNQDLSAFGFARNGESVRKYIFLKGKLRLLTSMEANFKNIDNTASGFVEIITLQNVVESVE